MAMALGRQVEERRSRTEAKKKGREGAKEEREQRKKEREDQKKQKAEAGRKKSDRIANGSSPRRRHKGTHAVESTLIAVLKVMMH